MPNPSAPAHYSNLLPSVQTQISTVSSQEPNPTPPVKDSKLSQSTQIPTPSKRTYCTKLEEVLPLRLNSTRLCAANQDSLVRTCSEEASVVKPLHSPDLGGVYAKENQIKMAAKDHDYGSNIAAAEPKEKK
ncbi:hypothetical protein CHARACLAT_032313, partial [Characodon lateralis]|nr:hypothetical protein [Characodon lateralis]